MAYQKASGVPQTGIMDKASLTKLYAVTAVKAPVSSASVVKKVSAVSQTALASESETIVYDKVIPTANAAAVGGTKETSVSTGGFAFFIILASVFLAGTFLLIKRVIQRKKKMIAVRNEEQND